MRSGQAPRRFLQARLHRFRDGRILLVKAQVNESPVLGKLMSGPNWILSRIKPPPKMPRMDIPGVWPAPSQGPNDA